MIVREEGCFSGSKAMLDETFTPRDFAKGVFKNSSTVVSNIRLLVSGANCANEKDEKTVIRNKVRE